MKKTVFSLSAIFAGAVLLFTGCENFLDGSGLKKEIDEKIEYAKELSIAISVTPEKPEYGQVSAGTITCKKGDTFDIGFSISSGYNFDGWICNVPSAIEFEDAKAFKTKATLKESVAGLIIIPVCYEKFSVKSVLPENKDGGVPCDSPILITFNHPVNPKSLGDFEKFGTDDFKVLIKSSIALATGKTIKDYYSTPILTNNNTILKISPKRENPLITAGTAMITVFVDESVSASNHITDESCKIENCKISGQLEKGYEYEFKMNSSKDSDSPLFVDFKVTSKKPSFNQTLETLPSEYDSFKDKITIDGETLITEIPDYSSYEVSEQFHIKDKLYIYCKAEDKGSGAYRLECDSISFPTSESDKKFVSTSENIYEIDDCEIDLSLYPDGEIELTFKLYDYCDNVCPDTKTYKVIKDTKIEQDGVRIYNKMPESNKQFFDVIDFGPQYTYATQGEQEKQNLQPNEGSTVSEGFAAAPFYYDSFVFDDYYKCIFVGNVTSDSWYVNTTELTPLKNNVKLFYTCNGVKYEAQYDNVRDCFIIEYFDAEEDLKLSLSITDSVGNTFISNKMYPCGNLSVDGSESISGDSLNITLTASKESVDSNCEISYRYFYEYEWNNVTETLFNKSANLSLVNYYASEYAGESWVDKMDPGAWNESPLKKILKICGLEYEKKYIVSLYTGTNRIVGWCPHNPRAIETVVFSRIMEVGENKSSIDYNTYSKELKYIDTTKTFVCYAVPVYRYTENGSTHELFGKPVKKSIVLTESAYNETYNSDFDITSPVSSGVNTGTCDATFNNVVIKDSTGKDCASDFSIEYFYKNGTNKSSFVSKNIKIASVAEETEIKVGFIATNIKDSSIVVKAEKSLTIQPVDNYPPVWNSDYYYATYNLYDDDRTGKNYYMNLQAFSYITRNSGVSYTYGDFLPMLNDKDGSGNKDFCSASGSYDYEYYWVSADGVWNIPDVKEGSFTPVQSGIAKIDWKSPFVKLRDASYKLWVPIYDMPDGEYYLVTKVFDENGNYVLTPHLFHDVNTFMDKPKLTLDGNSLQVKLILYGQGKVDRYSDLQDAYTGIQYLGSDSVWKPINLDSKMKFYDKYGTLLRSSFGNASYIINEPVDVSVAENRYIKCGVQGYHVMYTGTDRDSVGRYQPSGGFNRYMDSLSHETNTVPVYKFIGDSKGTYHKLIERDDVINIYCDGYTFAHVMYSTNPDGYGDNIDEWERRARELVVESYGYVYSPKQFDVDFNFYKDDIQECLPEDAKSYVVIAYFDDGERLISSVRHK